MNAQPRAFGLDLPEYPWEQLAPYRARAAQHPDGPVDVSIGTPVDPTPEFIREALAEAADAHGYPTTHGPASLREAIAAWFERRRGVRGLDPAAILPTVGSKELVAWLPLLLGLRPGDVVVRPRVAYPTYDIGAQLAGAAAVAADSLSELDPATRSRVRLVWVNSPGNPTGIVRDAASLAGLVSEAREIGAVVASDECYAELGWDEWDQARGGRRVPSILDPEVAGDSHELLIAVYSLSKQSNLAGYRASFAAGDPEIIANLVNSRKHAGMIVPAPVQAALAAAVSEDAHVQAQKDLYRERRALLKPALEAFGLRIEGSEAGLYLWGTAGEPAFETVGRLADLGIIAGPGVFYGEEGAQHVRVALTASTERIRAAAERLTAASSSSS
ncbi:succinyldiaminopimelate transaminase [Falsarthrobacter nasiphocae]|uniref:Succinyldiaminopimelate transaminase n=1 Tax=Falsarthrobacter nasiphocae TaxID=189863 RepID=A0AAE3YFW5_9MICC|nr:succinyldiaminopimelate transaminase [Falsarthrobacter nasiphocae]MDR6891492.1 succinyldiaminopimelate transaminase [Falsarthrobacter nasiphocae]